MISPDVSGDTLFRAWMQDLPEGWEAQACSLGAFVRARAVSSPAALLRLVFLFCGLGFSLRQTAAIHTALEAPLTDEAVRQRLHACLPWLRELLARLLPVGTMSSTHGRLLVFDSTHVCGPGAKGGEWKVHFVLELASLSFLHVRLTDDKTTDSLDGFPLLPGDLVLADRAYSFAAPMQRAAETGASLLLRYRTGGVKYHTKDGKPLCLGELLPQGPVGTTFSLACHVVARPKQDAQTLPVTLHALKLPPEVAEARRRRYKREGQKKGHTPRKETVILEDWMVLCTTLEGPAATTERLMALYRARWQIEMAIKRWKSVLHLSQLPLRLGSRLGEVWMVGKLLYSLLLQKKARQGYEAWTSKKETPFGAVVWRLLALLHTRAEGILVAFENWSSSRLEAFFAALCERPRWRSPQHDVAVRFTDALREEMSPVLPA